MINRENRNQWIASEARAYRLLYAQCFAVFLLVALVSALMPPRWKVWRSGNARHSIIDDARRATGEVVPLVFMH